VGRRDLEHRLGVGGAVIRLDQDGLADPAAAARDWKSAKPKVLLMAAFSGRRSHS
jgi:hypothetical protein